MSVVPIADQIYWQLRKRIVLTELRPGESLSVAQIASEFGASRTPVRDAIHRLSHDGLVEISPRSECRVKEITLKSMVDVLDAREASGPMIARLAAKNASDEDIDFLEMIAENNYPSAADVRSVLSASHLFHCRMAKLSGNERLHTFTELIMEDLERILRLAGGEPLHSEAPLKDHRDLIKALRARDGDLAEELEREHIRRSRPVTMGMVIDSGIFFKPQKHVSYPI